MVDSKLENPIRRFFPLLLIWLAMLIFSAANSIIAKIGHLGAMHLIEGRNPVSFCNVLFLGNFIAGLTLYAIHRKSWTKENLTKINAKDWKNLFILALFAGVLSPTFFFIGIMLTQVINVVLVSTLDIPFSLILGWLFTREKPSWKTVIASFLSVLGVVIIFLLHKPIMSTSMKMEMINLGTGALARNLSEFPFAGEICVAFGTFFNALAIQMSKKPLAEIPIGIFSVFRMIVGSIIFFIIAISIFGPKHFVDLADPFFIEWMLVYGGIVIALGIYALYKGMQQTTTADLAVTSAFQPVAGVIFAYLILTEIPETGQYIGGIFIMLGVGIALLDHLPKKRPPTEVDKPRGFCGV